MSHLVESLNEFVTPELVTKAAIATGEQESSISKAITGILPTLLNGLIHSNASNHSMLEDLLQKAGSNNNFINDLITGIGNENPTPAMHIGSSVIAGMYGSKAPGIANLVSNFSGIQSSSSITLMSIVGSILTSFLGKKMIGEDLHFSGILTWLNTQTASIESAVPTGFLQFINNTSFDMPVADKAIYPVNTDNEVKGDGMKWLLPLLLLAFLGIGMWYWLKTGNNESIENIDNEKAETSINSAADSAANAMNVATDSSTKISNTTTDAQQGKLDEAGNWLATKGEAIKVKLKNGVELDVTKGSLEDRFVSFIKDETAVAGKDTWFNFDDVLFEKGRASLKAGSEKQLENACTILKAYPEVTVKLGGYTDNTGDSMANMKLSAARAKTVYTTMIQKGLTKSSFDEKPFEGYGSQHPVADNSTPEGQAQNRRISLSVRSK